MTKTKTKIEKAVVMLIVFTADQTMTYESLNLNLKLA